MAGTWTAPPTFSSLQVLTSTAMNQLVGNGGDLNFLYGDTGYTAPSSFSNGWANTGSCGYRQVGTMVALRGGVSGGTANTTAFTLPAGYRPSTALTLSVGIPGGGQTLVVINTSGTVVPFTSPGSGVALDGIFFSTL